MGNACSSLRPYAPAPLYGGGEHTTPVAAPMEVSALQAADVTVPAALAMTLASASSSSSRPLGSSGRTASTPKQAPTTEPSSNDPSLAACIEGAGPYASTSFATAGVDSSAHPFGSFEGHPASPLTPYAQPQQAAEPTSNTAELPLMLGGADVLLINAPAQDLNPELMASGNSINASPVPVALYVDAPSPQKRPHTASVSTDPSNERAAPMYLSASNPMRPMGSLGALKAPPASTMWSDTESSTAADGFSNPSMYPPVQASTASPAPDAKSLLRTDAFSPPPNRLPPPLDLNGPSFNLIEALNSSDETHGSLDSLDPEYGEKFALRLKMLPSPTAREMRAIVAEWMANVHEDGTPPTSVANPYIAPDISRSDIIG